MRTCLASACTNSMSLSASTTTLPRSDRSSRLWARAAAAPPGSRRCADEGLGARHGAREALLVERLQQVVDRTDPEGVQRPVQARGHENHVGLHARLLERGHELEAVELGHVDV